MIAQCHAEQLFPESLYLATDMFGMGVNHVSIAPGARAIAVLGIQVLILGPVP